MSRCVIILSEKSSGSSALQNILARCADLRHVQHTRHSENETLFWTKAASVLGRPQLSMVDSEVPIGAADARADLQTLLRENLHHTPSPPDDEALVFDGWARLCAEYSPIFLEKSPHHLCQWSALELMLEAAERLPQLQFLFVGLVRNPMDTLYSQYSRWRYRPEAVERQWRVAYENLLAFEQLAGDRLVRVRYEEMVADLGGMQPIFDFCGTDSDGVDRDYLHGGSVQKWRGDRAFGFSLAPETIALAETLGYSRESLENPRRSRLWPLRREWHRARHRTPAALRRIAQRSMGKGSPLARR